MLSNHRKWSTIWRTASSNFKIRIVIKMFEIFCLQTPDCHSAQLTWNPGEDVNIEFGQQSPFELLLVLFTTFGQIRKVFDSKSFFVYSFILAHFSSLSYMYIMRDKIDEGVWDISLERSFFRDTLSCKWFGWPCPATKLRHLSSSECCLILSYNVI